MSLRRSIQTNPGYLTIRRIGRCLLMRSFPDDPRSGLVHVFIAVLLLLQMSCINTGKLLSVVARIIRHRANGKFLAAMGALPDSSCSLFRDDEFLWHDPMIAQLKGQRREP